MNAALVVERNVDDDATGMYAKEVEAEFNKYKVDDASGMYASEVDAERGIYESEVDAASKNGSVSVFT